MSLGLGKLRRLRKLLPRRRREGYPRRQYKGGYYGDKENLSERWVDLAQVADLRPTDIVLDMGCAEGLISLEVAKHVSHVDGIEFNPVLLERAASAAAEKNVGNASFRVGSVLDPDVLSKSYDVVLFLGVMGKRAGDQRVGLAELGRMLAATRRQIIVRVNIQKRAYLRSDDDFRLHDILTLMDQKGFDAICFDKREEHGNLIVGNRRGTGGRLRSALPNVVIPTEMMGDHPCLRDVPVAAPAGQDKASGE